MSVRQLQKLWKLQCINNIVKRTHCLLISQIQNYATGEACAKLNDRGLLKVHGLKLSQPLAKLDSATVHSLPQFKTTDIADLLKNLEVHYQRSGYVNYKILTKLMSELQSDPASYNQLLSTEQVSFLLLSCGSLQPMKSPQERLEIFERLWQYLEYHGQLTLEHHRIRLQVQQYNRKNLSDYRKFLHECLKYDANFDVQDLYADVLLVACCSGDMHCAREILEEMRAKNFALTEGNYNALILGHARNHDLKGSESVMDDMLTAGVPLSIQTQTMFIIALLENGQCAKACDIIMKFHGQFKTSQVLEIIRSCLYVDADEDFIKQIVCEFPAGYLVGSEVPIDLRNICTELLHAGKLETVIGIISTLPKPEFNENQNIDTFGVFLLQQLFHTNLTAEQIIKVCQVLKESGKNSRSLHIATEIAMHSNLLTVLPYFEALSKEEPLRAHYFWPMLMYNFRKSGEMGIISTIKIMTQFNVDCDYETLTQFILPYMAVLLENPEQAVKLLTEAGVKPSKMLAPILKQLLLNQNINDANKLVNFYPTKLDLNEFLGGLVMASVNVRVTKRYKLFAKLLASLKHKMNDSKSDLVGNLLLNMLMKQSRLRADTDAFRRFVEAMDQCELKVSAIAINAIQAQLSQNIDENTEAALQVLQRMRDRSLTMYNKDENSLGPPSSFMKHPRDMTLNELECHLIELEAKGLNTRGALRRLLQLCVRDERLEQAVKIKAKCEALQVQNSPGMLASIFDMYIKLKDIPNAEKSLINLKQTYPGFRIDEHKIIDYAALFVHEKKLEGGKRILQEHANTHKVFGGNYVTKNVWNFLNNVAHLAADTPGLTPEKNLTHDAFMFLLQHGYCKSQNTVLGPIVRERLLRNDIKTAIAEFRKLAEQYKSTPLQLELFSLLVRLSNQETTAVERYRISTDEAQQLLSEVIEVVAKVYGTVNMNSTLLIAFAEWGTDAQLRRLIINPEFRVNQELLIKNCEHLGQEGSIQTLLRLARGCRGLHNVIDERSIYNMLLSRFVQTNDFEAALKLYERLETDDDLKMSQDFVRNLVNLLKSNQIEIPSNIALRAQII